MVRSDDVLQETFLTVSAKADQYVEGTNFVAWACRIARFKVLEECKRSQKTSSALSSEVIEALCSTQCDKFGELREDQLSALKECLTSLSPHAKRAIELRYTRAHKITEIAEILGWSVDSIYVVLSRARNTLQQCINNKLGPEING